MKSCLFCKIEHSKFLQVSSTIQSTSDIGKVHPPSGPLLADGIGLLDGHLLWFKIHPRPPSGLINHITDLFLGLYPPFHWKNFMLYGLWQCPNL